jgi:hypothetical protein
MYVCMYVCMYMELVCEVNLTCDEVVGRGRVAEFSQNIRHLRKQTVLSYRTQYMQ